MSGKWYKHPLAEVLLLLLVLLVEILLVVQTGR